MSDEEGSSSSSGSEEVADDRPQSIFYVPKSFRQVSAVSSSEWASVCGADDDDVEVWLLTAPPSFDPQCFHMKSLSVDKECVIYADTNKAANVGVEFHLVPQTAAEHTDCLFNVFPKCDTSRLAFSFGKPFAKRLKVIEKIRTKGDPVENAKVAKKKLLPPPPTRQPKGLHVRYHPAGSDCSVLPSLPKVSQISSQSLILKQRREFLKAKSHIETVKQRKREEKRQRKAKREAKRAKKMKAAE
jgi:hypothetical protein